MTDDLATATPRVNYCPGRGNAVAEGRFCSECGRDTTASLTAVPAPDRARSPRPPAPDTPASSRVSTPPPRPQNSGPAKAAVIAGFGALGAVGALGVGAIVIAVVLLTAGGQSAANPSGVYRQKLSASLAPVLSANQALASSLQALNG